MRLASDEVRIWREKCELLEADMAEMRTSPRVEEPRDFKSLDPTFDLSLSIVNFDEPLHEAELSAIEISLDKIYVQRAALTSDLERIRQQLVATVDADVRDFTAAIDGLPPPAASPRGPVPPAMSPRAVASSAVAAVASLAPMLGNRTVLPVVPNK